MTGINPDGHTDSISDNLQYASLMISSCDGLAGPPRVGIAVFSRREALIGICCHKPAQPRALNRGSHAGREVNRVDKDEIELNR